MRRTSFIWEQRKIKKLANAVKILIEGRISYKTCLDVLHPSTSTDFYYTDLPKK